MGSVILNPPTEQHYRNVALSTFSQQRAAELTVSEHLARFLTGNMLKTYTKKPPIDSSLVSSFRVLIGGKNWGREPLLPKTCKILFKTNLNRTQSNKWAQSYQEEGPPSFSIPSFEREDSFSFSHSKTNCNNQAPLKAALALKCY